jgi:hypothetical protein
MVSSAAIYRSKLFSRQCEKVFNDSLLKTLMAPSIHRMSLEMAAAWARSYNASDVVGWSIFKWQINIFILKTRYAICCFVKFYNAGVVTHDRRIGSGAR